MALLRGKGLGLEIVLSGRDLEEALTELESRLCERPGFYRGTLAVAVFGNSQPTEAGLARLHALLDAAGIGLEALSGGSHLEMLAAASSLRYVSTGTEADGDEFARRRAMRPQRKLQLSDNARSLVADFAGARSDIAERRKRGDTSVRRLTLDDPEAAGKTEGTPGVHTPGAVSAPPGTLYHTGTLRGGQSLHNAGNIVVIGDVNPGAELVATGDVVVFGALRGIAHAGAQGDASAHVYAIDLSPTQLRIATYIAADNASHKTRAMFAEAACVRDGRIVVLPLDRIEHIQWEGLH